MKKWFCYFDFFKDDPITVGDPLILLCDGTEPVSFGEKIWIEMINKKEELKEEKNTDPYKKYSLYVVETLNLEKTSIALHVTSYRTGDFKSPFIITDGKEKVEVDNLSFTVKSILQNTKEGMRPEGPLGPFNFSKPPLGHSNLIFVFLFLLLLSWSTLFIRGKWKRHKLIKKINSRMEKDLKPSKVFFRHLREKEFLKRHSVQELEQAFKIFLENLFFIPAEVIQRWWIIQVFNRTAKAAAKWTTQTGQKWRIIQLLGRRVEAVAEEAAIGLQKYWIMQGLKRFHYELYQTEKQALSTLLNEFSILKKKPRDEKAYLQLKKTCQEMVLQLENKVKDKSF